MKIKCSSCPKIGVLGNAIMKVGTLHLCKNCSQIMNDRIKLAEAMGWTWDETSCKRGEFADNRCYWIKPNGLKWYPAKAMPDPFTDANDCDALIKHLNGLGYVLRIDFHDTEVMVLLEKTLVDKNHRKRTIYVGEYEGDNWKQGVCELALKVIE